jgi:hypothetical protein
MTTTKKGGWAKRRGERGEPIPLLILGRDVHGERDQRRPMEKREGGRGNFTKTSEVAAVGRVKGSGGKV